MVEIKKLDKITTQELYGLGHNGFITDSKYIVQKEESHESTVIRVELLKLKEPILECWPNLTDDVERYNRIITQGFSLGAYEKGTLVGVVIAETRLWNKTLWVWNIQVLDTHRRRGIASLLLAELTELAKNAEFRIIGLEVQSPNVPAITFYRKVGFELEGIDLSYYTNNDLEEKGHVALFMKKKLF